jgi:hypothetical protein
MKRIRVVLFVLLVTLLCSAMPVVAHAAPAGWTVKQIASDVYPWGNQVSGDRLVWAQHSGYQTSLCTIRPGIDSRVTTLTAYFSFGTLGLSGDNLIWESSGRAPSRGLNSDVLGAEGVLRSDLWAGNYGYTYWIIDPVVSGDRIAWIEKSLSSMRILTVRPGIDSTPSIVATSVAYSGFATLALSNNRLAWIDGPVAGACGTEYVVRTREMSTDAKPWTLYRSASLLSSIRVSGDHYAWRALSADGGHWQLLGRGLSTDAAVHALSDPYPFSDFIEPQLSEGHSVWTDTAGHLISNRTGAAGAEVQVAQDAALPVVSYDRIAWQSTDASPSCYTLVRGGSEVPVRLSPVGMAVSNVQVSGDGVMYAGQYSTSDPLVLYYARPSGELPALVTPWIDLTPEKKSVNIKRKSSLRFGGVMGDPDGSPLARRTIKLQVSSNYGRTWKIVSTLTTGTSGRVSKKLKLNKRGTFYYRWRAPASDGYTASNSNVLIVHVR